MAYPAEMGQLVDKLYDRAARTDDDLLFDAAEALATVTVERDQALAEVKEDDGVRRLLHRQLADAEARLAAAPHDSSCLIDWAGEGDNVYHYPNAGTCNCWKAAL